MGKSSVWLLFGTEKYLHDETEDGLDIRTEEKLLAIFTDGSKAEAYVEKSKAPSYREEVSWRNQGKGEQFVTNSLLHGCSGYVLKPLETPALSVDPEI